MQEVYVVPYVANKYATVEDFCLFQSQLGYYETPR